MSPARRSLLEIGFKLKVKLVAVALVSSASEPTVLLSCGATGCRNKPLALDSSSPVRNLTVDATRRQKMVAQSYRMSVALAWLLHLAKRQANP